MESILRIPIGSGGAAAAKNRYISRLRMGRYYSVDNIINGIDLCRHVEKKLR